MNTVGEEKFLAWYRSNAKKRLPPEKVLQRVADSYAADGRAVFVLPPEETKGGAAAQYAFRVEEIGCCGASTVYFYF